MAVAQRMYARALFEAAQEQGRLEVVHEQLGSFAAALAASAELQAFLENPEVAPEVRMDVLEEISGGMDELVRNFLRLTAEKGRSGEIAAIYAELDDLVARARGRLTVELTTAYELDDDEASAVIRKIEEASGKTVEAMRTVDPSLIGGMILQIGSMRADASVRGRLERLRQELVTKY